jgi:hypothetical protein
MSIKIPMTQSGNRTRDLPDVLPCTTAVWCRCEIRSDAVREYRLNACENRMLGRAFLPMTAEITGEYLHED